jgi:membrane-bound lytic murein transglycosylase F
MGFYRPHLRHLLVLLLCLSACGGTDQLDTILDSGELRVITRNSPTTYYFDKSGPLGYEYELARRLAEHLGVELKVDTAYQLQGIFTALERREADLAAAGLTLTGQRQNLFEHSAAYDTLIPQVIYVAGNLRPRSTADLVGRKIVVLKGSSHAEALRALQATGLPDLSWEEVPEADSMELLELLNSRVAELALVDSNEFTVQQSLYPRLKVAFDLGSEQDMVWYFASGSERLKQRIDQFFSKLVSSGEMATLREHHFGHTSGVSRIGSHTFSRNMQKKLPPVRDMIEQVAEEFQMDWHLLAAIAYQESHWDPTATSPTGVRGMMMLTLPTAREMDVNNRLDALQSLRGGARYLKNLKRRLPNDIYEPDRTWFALAAYNIGLGHLEDARVLTDRQGADPHIWADVVKRLPQLQLSKYYSTVKHGYARGLEATTYVQNIRHYDTILKWQGLTANQPRAPLSIEQYLPRQLQETLLLAL